jgi:membrane-bound inhibitor of C-type lysozyme
MGDPKYSAAPALVVLLAVASCQAADRSPEPAGDTIGPVTFRCDDGSAIEATFDNAPNPATVQLVRGDQTFTLPQALSASGARYVGDGIEFWNKGDDAMVDWQGRKFSCSEAE